MSTSLSSSTIFEGNPYEGHPHLSELEAEVLWQYAKLSQNIKEIIVETRRVSDTPDQGMLKRLRALEVKMGLVLTLFKASVWAFINEQNEQGVAEPSVDYADTTANDTTIRR